MHRKARYKTFPSESWQTTIVSNTDASAITEDTDIFITDPPYGDAVKYEEILEFFIAWLRKNPPPEFADWVWDSRRSLAIKGDGEDFRRGMVAAYKRMTEMHAGQRHPGHHVYPPVREHLGGHGEHRLGLRPAGHRSVVCGHRDRECPARRAAM